MPEGRIEDEPTWSHAPEAADLTREAASDGDVGMLARVRLIAILFSSGSLVRIVVIVLCLRLRSCD